MKSKTVVLVLVLCSCGALALFLPAASADAPAGDGQALMTGVNLTMTNVSLANVTLPAEYQETPSLIKVGISTNDSAPGAPKGEMAAVPRTIGFSISPGLLVIVIVLLAAVGIGVWYVLRHHRDGDNNE